MLMVAPGLVKPDPLDPLRRHLKIRVIHIGILFVCAHDDDRLVGHPLSLSDVCSRNPLGGSLHPSAHPPR